MVCVVGAGHLGSAMVGQFLARGLSVQVIERNPVRRRELPDGVLVESVPLNVDVVVAVKPADTEAAVRFVANASPLSITSVAAGIRLTSLQKWAPGIPVLRAMPNVAARVGESATAIVGGAGVPSPVVKRVTELFGHLGSVVCVEESHLDAVTAVAGSGPAYVFLFAEALIAAAVSEGLDESNAIVLVRQLLRGSAALLDGASPGELRASVTTPGGTTAAGLAVFEREDLSDTICKAIGAAAARSRELGQ